MFLGKYDYEGDPVELLAAYDRVMAGMPADSLIFHICIQRDGGITVYDACPSAEVFASFSSSPEVLGAMTAAGLPTPVVTQLGESHRAMAAAAYVQ